MLKHRASKAVLKTIQETKPFCIQPSKSYRTLTLLIIFKQCKESVATAAVLAGCQYMNKGCLDFTTLSLILHWKFDRPSYHLILPSANHPDSKQKHQQKTTAAQTFFPHLTMLLGETLSWSQCEQVMRHSQAWWEEEAWWKVFPEKTQKPNRELSAYWPHISFALRTEEGRVSKPLTFTAFVQEQL